MMRIASYVDSGEETRVRAKRWALALFLVVALALLGAGWVRHAQRGHQPDPRLATIHLFLNSQQWQDPWFSDITGLELHGNDLYVRTSLPARDFTREPPPEFWQTARPIYDALWDYVAFQHPEIHISRVIVLDRYGNYLDGGQA